MRALTILLAAAIRPAGAATSYAGHQVLRLTCATEEQAAAADRLGELVAGLDYWSEIGRTLPTSVDVRVTAESASAVRAHAAAAGLTVTTLIADVQDALDVSATRSAGARFTDAFQTYDTTMRWLSETVVPGYPELASVQSIGTSYEGRDLAVLKITAPSAAAAPKPVIFVLTLIHAREWLSGATANWIAEALLEGHGTDARITSVLEHYELQFLLIGNPDGYEYSHTTERFWRKTRKPSGDGCVGTDPNRNFATPRWGEVGVSSDPCSEIYPGEAPADQPEVAAIQRHVLNLADRMAVFIDAHTYSQMLLSPWGCARAEISEISPRRRYPRRDRLAQVHLRRSRARRRARRRASRRARRARGGARHAVHVWPGGVDDLPYGWRFDRLGVRGREDHALVRHRGARPRLLRIRRASVGDQAVWRRAVGGAPRAGRARARSERRRLALALAIAIAIAIAITAIADRLRRLREHVPVRQRRRLRRRRRRVRLLALPTRY